MNVTVIIVTLNRSDCVRTCLERLEAQRPLPDQLIVVDASKDDRTRDVVHNFPSVIYLRNENGYGRMTASRNIGLRHATGDIVAFLDDDAFAHDGWLAALTACYDDPVIGAVGGRALNAQPGEATQGVGEIGTLKSNGVLTGNFAADPGRRIDVDHVIGCNMSFRRAVLAKLGGFREDYPGISGVREDSDMCFRVRSAGYRIVFTPDAVVDHIGAPQVKGKRFDTRYTFFASRNHAVLLVRNHGPLAMIVWRYLGGALVQSGVECARKIGGAIIRFVVAVAGTFLGYLAGVRLLMKTGRDPVRRDADGEAIRKALSQSPTKEPEKVPEVVSR